MGCNTNDGDDEGKLTVKTFSSYSFIWSYTDAELAQRRDCP